MGSLVGTLLGGIALAAISLYAFDTEAQQISVRDPGGFRRKRTQTYPLLTGISVFILLLCILISRRAHPVFAAFAVLIFSFYVAFYVVIAQRLSLKHKEVSRIAPGTIVTADSDFVRDMIDPAGRSVKGFVTLGTEQYPAFIAFSEMAQSGKKVPLPKRGERLVVDDTDEFFLAVRRDPDVLISRKY